MAFDFDLFTIGAGSGGVAASRRAGSHGAKVTICEDVRVGGTCVLRGCVPKKLLVIGSHFSEDIEDARGYGWTASGTLDWPALIAAKDKEIDRLNGVYLRMLRDSGVELIEGRGVIVDPHTVEVNGKRYTAKHILIATGGAPIRPEIPGVEHVITSDEALSLKALPNRLIVVGGGYIGCELAAVFRAAGSSVTMLIRGDTLLRGFDEDVRAAITVAYRKKGIEIMSEVVVRDVEREPDGSLNVLTKTGDTLDADAVLFAIGRWPNTRNLGLEQVGITVDENGAIPVDDHARTSVKSIFAVGDVTNRVNLTPVAITEGRALVEMLFNNGDGALDHANVPSAVFSQPPIGTVGCGEATARARGEIDVYVSSFRPMKHTLSGRDERTMMKLIVDRNTQKVIGVHMVGPDAPEIIQGFAVALRCGATKQDFDRTVGIHPTAAEEFVTMREKRPDPVSHEP